MSNYKFIMYTWFLLLYIINYKYLYCNRQNKKKSHYYSKNIYYLLFFNNLS